MRAQVGDQLVVESTKSGATRRDGEIVGLHHGDGTPPYDVRWSGTDEVSVVVPGPDAHVHHVPHREHEGYGTPREDRGVQAARPGATRV